EELSHREVDILELAASDVPNREIARRLVLSEHTVKWYWKQIFGKLNVHRRLQAVISARAAGLIH
ncbi:MAG TPA: helix-turn-helix transcriptional regulator, partial [Steroidobacteraceae bacterium]|nr:helix-turn-helix transcriptional regulator [Steroidobacteraceae bacterium]